jgi:hypothetical protein
MSSSTLFGRRKFAIQNKRLGAINDTTIIVSTRDQNSARPDLCRLPFSNESDLQPDARRC